jgi:hypothetical protein
LVISLIALFVALGGTSLAASNVIANTHRDSIADTRLVKKLAPTLTVKRAKVAQTAAHAFAADEAGSADNATNATNATAAQTADVSNAIGSVAYVKGSVADAPANGGSGFGESNPSTATCPAGTVLIGSAEHTAAAGIEVSKVDAIGAPPNAVDGLFDNFTNSDVSGNYMVAICSAAHSVSNPSGLLGRAGTR